MEDLRKVSGSGPEVTPDQPYVYIDANVNCLPDKDKNAYVAAGKALSFFSKMEGEGSCGLERGSVYGAAVAIPQVARSAGYSRTLTSLALRSYLFLTINIAMQLYLLSMIGEEAHVMSGFAGQPHLCDFGRRIKNCPDATDCTGPGGTKYTFPRLYDFPTWATRTFVRDSLKAIFPDREEDIQKLADPGEYGLENYWCRLVCCFIFMMAVMEDFRSSLNLILLLWNIPTAPEKWLRYEVPNYGHATSDKFQIKLEHGWRELDLVRFGVAGMPAVWKFLNVASVVLPKLSLWVMLTVSGTYFLMETAGIVDGIMNSVALTFILSLDEMVFSVFTTTAVKHIMANIEDYELFTVDQEEQETEEEVLHRFCREEFGPNSWGKFFKTLNPKRLWYVLTLMILFVIPYYYMYCQQADDGSWYSKPVRVVQRVEWNPVSFIFPFKAFGWHVEDEPVWAMPGQKSG